MRTVERWRWSTTTPSGACSSGGSRSSAGLPAHPDDGEEPLRGLFVMSGGVLCVPVG